MLSAAPSASNVARARACSARPWGRLLPPARGGAKIPNRAKVESRAAPAGSALARERARAKVSFFARRRGASGAPSPSRARRSWVPRAGARPVAEHAARSAPRERKRARRRALRWRLPRCASTLLLVRPRVRAKTRRARQACPTPPRTRLGGRGGAPPVGFEPTREDPIGPTGSRARGGGGRARKGKARRHGVARRRFPLRGKKERDKQALRRSRGPRPAAPLGPTWVALPEQL